MIWLFLSVGGARLHRLSRLSSIQLSCIVDGRSALRTLLDLDVGRLTSGRREFTSSERGDWKGRMVLRAGFGVIVVLVGFSLAIMVHVVVPMVEQSWCGLTSIKVSGMMMRSEIIIIPLMARLLAFLCHGCPINVVLMRPLSSVVVLLF